MNPTSLYAWFRQHPTTPLVLFIVFVLILGVVAVASALRNSTSSVDTVIKVIAGWAALVFVFFGPFVVFTLAWANGPKAYQKELGIVYLILGVLTTIWLLLYAIRRMF